MAAVKLAPASGKVTGTILGNSLNIAGHRYNRLSVNHFVGKDKHGYALWDCSCTCGNIIITSANQLRTGKTKSCGCLNREKNIERNKKRAIHTVKGDKPATQYRAYISFLAAMNRCKPDGHKDYGKRGIRLKLTFQELIDEIGEKPKGRWSLDRIDVNGHYEKGNIRWATDREQSVNKRITKTAGVFQKENGFWRAYVSVNRKIHHLGTYKNKRDAIKARKNGMIKYGYC